MPEITAAPHLPSLYLKAAVTGPTRRGGDALPDAEYVRRDVTVDREHLAAYNRVCGFGLRDELPVTYPHMPAFGMAVRLMTDAEFPFPLVGLVHVANEITQYRPVLVTDTFDQRVYAAGLRPHPKGKQFDMVTETYVGDELVWREASTYLRRGKSDPSAPRPEPVAEVEAGSPTARWRLPGDLGRSYAAVSGDSNPIHMHALPAKAFGFPKAIAHGMWSKARSIAALEGRLPEAFTVSVEFRKPVLLPSTAEFTAVKQNRGWDVALHSRSGKAHLQGAIRAL